MSAGGGHSPTPPPLYSEVAPPPFGYKPLTDHHDETALAPEPVQPPSQMAVMQTIAQPPFGPNPVHTVCPYCHATISSKVVNEETTKTHLIALVLCAIGCFLCCCIPYCMDECKNANHYCPECNAYLGQFKR